MMRGRTNGWMTLAWIVGACGVATAQDAAPAQSAADERPQIDAEALAMAQALEQDLVDLAAEVSEAFVVVGGGSGIIVSPDGEILTNHHVAGSREVGDTWYVVRPGRVIEPAVLVATDPRGDISLLKLQGEGPYPYVELADSDQSQVGQAVVALGNPFGFSKDGTPNVTFGVVSAVHRLQGGYTDAIQTDAAINPGNSGGPLLDMDGRLIGINGKIAVRWGTRSNSGVGFAIPSNQIDRFMPRFREGGVVDHATLTGLQLASTTAGGDGARVRRVNSSSRAAAAGLQRGDLIVEADGRPVHSPERFQGIVGTLPEGEPMEVVVLRDGQRVAIQVVTEAHETGDPSGAFLGVRMTNADGGGVGIEEVVEGSPAAAAGLLAGDVVKAITIGGSPHPLADRGVLVQLLTRLSPGDTVTLAVEREGETVEVEVTLGER